MRGCRPNAPKTCEGIMTPSQVCKHQVCDYCSGRFGMVTHRRWGNKFCKRTCKNAYLRENYRTLSDWIIPRFFFAGGACLATALAVAVLTLLSLASAHAAPDEEQPAATVSLEFNKDDGTLYIDLSGPIVASTADDVRAAQGKYGTALNRVVPFLDSAGGRVDDGDRLIEVLNEIKLRHQLITVVPHGKLCASMCIRRGSGCPAGTAAIVDDDALPEGLAQRLTDDARRGIGRASGREIDDQRDRTAGIILPRRPAAPPSSVMNSRRPSVHPNPCSPWTSAALFRSPSESPATSDRNMAP